jgi:hypothetical protein
MRLQLKGVEAKAANYLHQLSFASWVRDSTWANRLHLEIETFRTWWQDPTWKMDLNLVNIKDVPCTGETIQRLTSLGREETPDVAGIDEFNYNPEADHSEAALEGGKVSEAST